MLDQELLNKLPSEAQSQLKKYEAMFATEGWGLIKAWLEKSILELEQRLIHAQSWEDNRALYGKLYGFREILNLEEATVAEYTALAMEVVEEESQDLGFELEFE